MIIELQGYKITLPDPPPKEEIDGYNLPIEEQYWKKPYNLTDEEYLSLPEDEQDEIVERENDRRVFGYWFMNKGKPFYLTGDNYFFLTFWTIDGQPPQFIINQAKNYYFEYLVDNDPYCFGSIELKPRREGRTQRKLSALVNRATLVKNKHFGIQSKTGDDAKNVNFLNLVLGYRNLPVWIHPQQSGMDIPKKELVFDKPSKRSALTKKTGVKDFDEEDSPKTFLKTKIDWGSTVESYYDGKKLYRYLMDEAGKWSSANAYETWGIVKKCLMDGFDIIGKAYLFSTIGETDEVAADNFIKLWNESDAAKDKRTPNGYTISGLYRYFIPSYSTKRGKDPRTGKELINKYGEVDEVAARELILNERKSIKDPRKLFIEIKQNPLTIEEALHFGSNSSIFDNMRLNNRYNALKDFQPSEERPVKYLVGNLGWENNEKYSKVHFIPNENGKWKISYLPNIAGSTMTNRVKRLPNGTCMPFSDTQFIMGIDPFDYDAEDMTTTTGSKGAFHIKLKYNFEVPDLSYIYCCQYFYREADARMFYDDVAKTMFFYGARINPERKLYGIWRYLKDNGLLNFSMIRPDMTKQSDFQKRDNGYGTPTGEDTKRLGAELWENYMAAPDPMDNEHFMDNLDRFWFEESIEQLMKYNPKESTKYDLVMSLFMTEIGSQSIKKLQTNKSKPKEESIADILFPRYDNSGVVARPIPARMI